MKSSLSWRPATAADIPALVQLANTANRIDDPARVVVADDIIKASRTPNPEKNTLLGVDAADGIVAYASVLEPADGPLAVTVEAVGVVHPEYRAAGLGTKLIKWQETRAREMFAGRDAARPKWLETAAAGTAHSARKLLTDHGFVEKRCWLEMARELSDPIPAVKLPEGVRITTPHDFSEATRLAYNDAFQDHWGSRPDSRADWEAREARADYRPDLSFIAVAKDSPGAPEVTGLVTTQVSEEQFEARGGPFAYIHLLGVRRAWRGKGIASALLNHSMRVFKQAGFERAELNVDSSSLTGAVGVYENLGFREALRHSTFIKEL